MDKLILAYVEVHFIFLLEVLTDKLF